MKKAKKKVKKAKKEGKEGEEEGKEGEEEGREKGSQETEGSQEGRSRRLFEEEEASCCHLSSPSRTPAIENAVQGGACNGGSNVPPSLLGSEKCVHLRYNCPRENA